ncbi:MAG: 50S ribosomal protein L25 [Desulfococcaceae bacterium]
METVSLKAHTRETRGKGAARVLRREGRIPAVLYGRETAATPISVELRALETILREGPGNVFIDLNIEEEAGAKPHIVMVKDMEVHPTRRDILHADFYQVDMKRKIRVEVPVVTEGIPAGVEEGGILQVIRRELEVWCLPNNIPQEIVIDVSHLGIGDSIHIEEVPAGEGVEYPHDVNFTVVAVASPTMEAEAEEEEAEKAEGAEEGEEEGAAPEEEA